MHTTDGRTVAFSLVLLAHLPKPVYGVTKAQHISRCCCSAQELASAWEAEKFGSGNRAGAQGQAWEPKALVQVWGMVVQSQPLFVFGAAPP